MSNAAKGNTWLEFVEGRLSVFQNGVTKDASVLPNDANHRYYLTTWNNTAMIQTGHSNGESTEDERKVLANTLFYLKQLTKKTEVLDNSARDIAEPNNPSNITTMINEYNITSVKFRRPEDNGSTYEYYVKGLDGSREFTSEIKSATITTGVKKYKYIVDENPTSSKDLIAEAGTEYESSGENEEIAIGNIVYNDNRAKYIHIYAIDGAGNTSEVQTQKLEFEEQEIEVKKRIIDEKPEYKIGDEIRYVIDVNIKENETNKGKLTNVSIVDTYNKDYLESSEYNQMFQTGKSRITIAEGLYGRPFGIIYSLTVTEKANR
jgi:hypothetical protein